MGCLFELFAEILLEGILDLVWFSYIKIAHIWVPSKEIPPKTENRIKNIVTTVSVLLVLTLFIGLMFLLPDDKTIHAIGKYMTFIPLSIIGLQVVLGMIVMVVKLVKRNKK